MEFTLESSDGKKIHGKLSGEPPKSVVVLLHGMPGSMDDDLFESAEAWFVRRGYAVCRYNQYGPDDGSRQLMECDFEVMNADLANIVEYLRRNNFEQVFLVGYSFGGLLTLRAARQKVAGAVLWDPSYELSLLNMEGVPRPKYIDSLDAFALQCGVNYLVSCKLVEQLEDFPWTKAGLDFSAPLKIVIAGRGLLDGAKEYALPSAFPRSAVTLEKADHDFGTEVRDELFTETHEWFVRALSSK